KVFCSIATDLPRSKPISICEARAVVCGVQCAIWLKRSSSPKNFIGKETRKNLFEEVVQPGATWSHVLKRGTSLRLIDVEGGANVGAMFYNWENPTERYNMPDTLKAQHIAHLTRGHVLYSDMGRVLCSITDDSAGWHDPLSGCSNAALVKQKYGEARYQ